MKICIINAAAIHGGASAVAMDIATGMSRNGHEVMFVCAGGSGGSFESDGYQTIILRQSLRSPLFHYVNPELIWKLNRVFQRYRFDILHFHNINLQTFSLAALFFSMKYPVLWTVHDVWPLCVTGWPDPPDCIGMLKRCHACRSWPRLFVRASRWLKEATYRLTRFSVAFPSRWIQQASVCSSLSARRNFVIHNGVDEGLFYRKECAQENDTRGKITLLYCGGKVLVGQSPAFRKGWQYFLKAVETLYESFDNIQILYVGDPIEIPKSIQVPILFAAGVQRENMSAFYSISDIFILPTLGDNFPLTILEAMASMVPVVATSVGGIPEIIEDGISGMLCDARDHQSIADAVKFLIDYPETRRKIARAAYEKYLRRYTLEKMVQSYEAAYYATINKFSVPHGKGTIHGSW